jgi:hypothetical protein
MARRSSSLNRIDSGVSREINSNFDDVRKVAENITAVVTVAGTDLAALTSALEEATDFTGITVVSGDASSWDPVTKVLTVKAVKGGAGEKGDKGDAGATGAIGARGPQGVRGEQGVQGVAGPMGPSGADGDKGDKGDKGDSVAVDSIVNHGNGTFTWNFTDGTSYLTPSLKGDRGDQGLQGIQGLTGVKGEQGVSVHHLKVTNTTDFLGRIGREGQTDVYTVYGDAAETITLGYFPVQNGSSVYSYAVEGGFEGDEEVFYTSITEVGSLRDEIIALVGTVEGYVTEAESSAEAAELSRTQTELLFNTFGDQYLGAFETRPTLDNSGNPLTVGDIYFDTLENVLKFFSGSAWVAPEAIATQAAAEALDSASDALSYRNITEGFATVASDKADEASTSATNAGLSAGAAGVSATNAGIDAAATLGYKNEAEGFATVATNKASESSTSASQALSSANNAASSASQALVSANNATSSEGNSLTYSQNSLNSANAAALSAENALSSENNASTSESTAVSAANTATTQAGIATTAASDASGYKDTSVASLESFRAKWLDAAASDPVVDGNGDPLAVGAVYFNTTSNSPKVYNGVEWGIAVFDATGAVLSFNGRYGYVTLTNSDVTGAVGVDLSGVEAGAQVNAVTSVAGKTGAVTLVKGDVGLADVDNTADASKHVASASKLTTARTIALSGALTGSVSFDGSANATITATVVDDSHSHVISNIDGLESALTEKVDKVTGKGLSDENYTLTEKDKLSGIEAGAQVNTVTSVAGKTGDVVLVEAHITDLDKYTQAEVDTALSLKAEKTQTSNTESKYIDSVTTTQYKIYVEDGNIVMEEL